MARGRIGLVLAMGVVLVTGGCGDDEDFGDSGAVAGEWRTAGCGLVRLPHQAAGGVPGTPPRLEAAMARIDRGGRREFAASFAGIEVDERRGRAIVYRVPSAAFDDFIREAAEDACVVVRDAAHSGEALTEWHDRVLADLGFWTHQGVQIVSIGARHDGSGVEVGVRDVPRARRELLGRYGQDAPLLFVEQEPVRPLPGRVSPS
jgi:hypothetical protein